MPTIHETRSLPYSAEQMFDLVADVERYPQFLPWVVGARIKSDNDTVMVADMLVGFSAIREKFTSRVEKHRPETIHVAYVDGPLRDLDNHWVFHARGDSACDIEFDVKFAFRNPLLEKLAGQYFERAFRKMVAAFEKRAVAIYGSNKPSAISAA